jgi:virginiamycin B lyase
MAGVITEFSVPTASAKPEFIVAGPDGNLWFTEFEGNQLGRVTPLGVFTEFPIPTAGQRPIAHHRRPRRKPLVRGSEREPDRPRHDRRRDHGVSDPHRQQQSGRHHGRPDGNLWFNEEDGNQIAKITTAGVITEFPIPTAGSAPGGICLGSDGNLWFTEYNAGKIARLTTAGVVTEFPIPPPSGGPLHPRPGPDGAIWFVEEIGNRVGRSTTAGVIVEYVVPTANASPFDIVAGPDGAMWFTEEQKIGRLTTSTETEGFFTVAPCRVADTRTTAPPALAAGDDRTFLIKGKCGIPATAKSVSLNVTVTQPTAPGAIRLYPTGQSRPSSRI